MAVAILKRHRPMIIGITGSVGKSSTKEAIALVLKGKFDVRKNEENYNNEIGIPLTIIGAKSGKHSIIGWLTVIVQWFKVMFFMKTYPKILVLELGIDRPGDMQYLLSFLPLQIGVMTNVSSNHLEFFKTKGQIAREKGLLIKGLPESGTAILCADDDRVIKYTFKTKAKVITYGFNEESLLCANHISFSGDTHQLGGCHFKITFDGKTLPVHLPLVVAEHHIQAVLAGMACGMALKLNPLDMVAAVREFQSLPGRMRMIEGIQQSWIIDDTYNSSPLSLHAAMSTLAAFKENRRVVVLGDMLELGNESESAHKKVAEWIMEYKIDVVMLVGRRMLVVHEILTEKGFAKDKSLWFDNPLDAADATKNMIEAGDVVLVKGSQGMRMEKVSETLMTHPEKSSESLCRQSDDWKHKPFTVGV